MKIDIAQSIGAVTRTVLEREHNGRPARVIVATRPYDAEITEVWDAMTNAERMPRWFLPISVICAWGDAISCKATPVGR